MFDRPINWRVQLGSCAAAVVMVGATCFASTGTTDVVETHNVETLEIIDQEVVHYPLVSELADEYRIISSAVIDKGDESTFQIEDEITKTTYLMYVDGDAVRYRSEPELSSDTAIGVLSKGTEVPVVDQEGHWCKCIIDDQVVYIHATLLADTNTVVETEDNESYSIAKKSTEPTTIIYDSEVPLNSELGRVQGPSGEETYYNLNMTKIVNRMKSYGYDYEYWIREDGVKMYGDYVLVAANFDIRPIGTILETSLGTGIVADCGDFVESNPTGIDIATNW